MKKIIFIDLDDTLADFYGAANNSNWPNGVDEGLMYDPGFFFNLKPIPGALKNIRRLLNLGFDVQILTQPLYNHPECYLDKVKWVCTWLPELSNKIILTQDKGLIVGEYLIDDNKQKWEIPFSKNGGEFIRYGTSREEMTPESHARTWENIYKYFSTISPERTS